MDNAKCFSTPLGSHIFLSKDYYPRTKKEEEDMWSIPYTNDVGSIMYVVVCRHPDIAQAVSMVSRYVSNPGKQH